MSSLKEMWSARRNRKEIYRTSDFWDEKARRFDGDAASMWTNLHLNDLYTREALALIDEFLGDFEGLRILDVGCGTGRMSRFFAAQGGKVTGLDFSEETLQIARRESVGVNPSYRKLSLFDLDQREEYEIVFSWGVLAIAARDRPELEDGLRRIRSALKKEGRAVFMEPLHRGFLCRVLEMSSAEFLECLLASGFRVTEVRHMHFWPARLALAYIPLPRWLTIPVYRLGQWILALLGYRRMGDYVGILAVRE